MIEDMEPGREEVLSNANATKMAMSNKDIFGRGRGCWKTSDASTM